MNFPKLDNLLTARPKNMDFAAYKLALKQQNKMLKTRKKGVTVWFSNGVPNRDEKGEVKTFDLEGVKMIDWVIKPQGTLVGKLK